MSSSTEGKYVLFHYDPSPAAAGIFVAIFLLSTLVHAWQVVRTRTWYFIPMIIACAMEALGYVGRIIAARDKTAVGPYVMQSVLLLVAPAIYAASIYVILGRLIVFLEAEHHSSIPVRWLTKLFVAGDVLSFLAQSTGGALLGTSNGDPDKMKTGERAILGGLGIQILFFGFFIVVIVLFHSRIRQKPTRASDLYASIDSRYTWKLMLYVLYIASALIMVRSIFRVVEYVQGNNGALMKNEVWLYIFDAALMAIVAVIFNFCHPSRVLTRPYSSNVHEMSAA